mgnify:CR=1 FL=1
MNVQEFFDKLIQSVIAHTKEHNPVDWEDFGNGPEYIPSNGVDIPQHPLMLVPLDGKKLVVVNHDYDETELTITWAIVLEDNHNEVMYDTGEVDEALAYISLTGMYDSYDGTNFYPQGEQYMVDEVKPTVVPVVKYLAIND